MKSFYATTFALASYIPTDMPLQERLDRLQKNFDPPIGSVVMLDRSPRSNLFQLEKQLGKMSGHITVNPPPNHCFIVTKSRNEKDIKVCKKTEIKFFLTDVNEKGELHWELNTGEGDFGTPIMWKTPYLQGSYVDLKMDWPGPSKPLFVSACRTEHTHEFGRRLYVKLVTGEEWIIKLPDSDKLVEQPEKKEFEDLQKKVQVGGIKLKTIDRNTLIRLVDPADYQKLDQGEWVRTWTIPLHHSYEMSSSNFIAFGDKSPGAKSKCRYRFSGVGKTEQNGLFECHGTSNFKWIYLNLSCISELELNRR